MFYNINLFLHYTRHAIHLFVQSYSVTILFRINEVKVTEKSNKVPFSATLTSIIYPTRFLHKIFADSDRPYIACLINSVVVMQIFDVKLAYVINLQ